MFKEQYINDIQSTLINYFINGFKKRRLLLTLYKNQKIGDNFEISNNSIIEKRKKKKNVF